VRVTVESREPAAAQTPSTVSDPAPVIHFESNQAVPDPRADAVADPATGATPAPPPTKTAQKKTKKRRPSDSDDMQTSISKGFYSLQKQWSSMFD
jgi:hypothetical protein